MVTPQGVNDYLGGNLTTSQVDELTEVCTAVNVFVSTYATDAPPGQQALGAKMLAARLFRRRNSPGGVENMNDMSPVYIQRNDPDIALLLRIGAHRLPKVR